MTGKDIAIFGAGGFGREVLVLLHQINAFSPTWRIKGFFDDQPQSCINGFDYLGDLEALNAFEEPLHVVLALGDSKIRARVRNRITNPRLLFPPLIHPSVPVQPYQYISVGEGSVICQGNILTTNITVGRFALINLSCTVGHDVRMGDFCSLMPGVNLGGYATLAAGVSLGTNATLLPAVHIGEESTVGAGAVVIKDLPPRCTAVGVPAHVIKQHDVLS
jgi:sugar O-acyltransferase (sialic acid O-acetyltransferase NeuD family)